MPKAMATRKQYPAVIAAVCNTPWALMEDRVQAIADVLTTRAAGTEFTQDEIRERLACHQSRRLGAIAAIGGEHESTTGPQIIDGVAVIPVHGTLAPRLDMFEQMSGGTSTQELQSWIMDAATNPKVKAILLDVDSPGGDAHGNEEVASLLRQVREQMPVKAVITNLGASAGYYIASSAGEVIASPSAEVGSIGVYFVHGESSKADEKDGLTYTVFRTAENKNSANSHEPLTDKSRAVVQERMDALYSQFIASVAAGRGVSTAHVLANFGQGKVMLAEAAQKVGMVDRVGTIQQVFNELRQTGKTAPTVRSKEAVTVSTQERKTMNPLVKASLIEAGLVDADAADAVCEGVAKAFAQLHHIAPDDHKALASALLAGGSGSPSPTDPPATSSAPQKHHLVPQAVQEAAVAAERTRCKDIRDLGATMRGISDESIQTAIDNGLTADEARAQFVAQVKAAEPPVGVSVTKSQDDKFAAAAVDALCLRAGLSIPTPAAGAHQLQHASADDLIRQCLGGNAQDFLGRDRLELAAAALRGDGMESYFGQGGFRSQTTATRPSDLPNILSAVMGKMLDNNLTTDEFPYAFYAKQIQSVSDFNPKTIIRTGYFPEMEMTYDGDEAPEVKNSEEANWIKVDEYKSRRGLTPQMLINEQMGAFLDDVALFSISFNSTIDRLCRDQLLSGICGDGVTLFDDSAHGNLVASGATISTTTLNEVNTKIRNQKDVDDRQRLGLRATRILVPTELDLVAQQVLRRDLQSQPTSDGSINPYRGQFDFRVDPNLSDNSTTAWYAFAEPSRAAAIVFTFLRGMERMQRRTWFDVKTETRYVEVKSAFAAAVNNYRAVIKNPGV